MDIVNENSCEEIITYTTMKKTYMIPRLYITQISCESLIAESVGINKDTTVEGENGGWVKGDNASRSDYNVWNDDWSK